MTFQPDAATAGGRPTYDQVKPGIIIAERYELTSKVGDGGHGTVWRAHDKLLRRDVAVKEVTLPPELPPEERQSRCQRTLREAQAAASLSHPSVVRVFDVITENGRPWIVMELLQARSLAEIISQSGPMPVRAVAKIGLALTGALEAAHSSGILHRDVKPGNVLINSDGRCVLSDFGAAAGSAGTGHTAPGMVLGSAHYIAPERAVGGPAEPASDMFSLGVTLYTALEGRPPFDRGGTTATMHAVVHEPPEAPRNAGPLGPLLAALLEKDPNRRSTVTATRNALNAALTGPIDDGGRPVSGGPVSGGPISGIPHGPHGASPQYPPAPPPPPPYPSSPPPHHTPPPPQHTSPFPEQGAYSSGYGQRPEHSDNPPPLSEPKKKNIGGIAAGAGALIIIVLIVVVVMNLVGSGGETPEDDPAQEQTKEEVASFDSMLYTDEQGRYTVSVPEGWNAAPHGKAIDIKNPEDETQWLRFNVTNETAPKVSLEQGEPGLAGQFTGYEQIRFEQITISGMDGWVLEYSGTNKQKQQRHGVWALVTDGKTGYHVYMSVPEEKFEESMQYYDLAKETFTPIK